MCRVSLPRVLPVRPLSRPPDLALRPPGSKSITNRALLCAALADGRSELTGVLYADDTWGLLQAGGACLAFVMEEEHPDHLAFKVSGEEFQAAVLAKKGG